MTRRRKHRLLYLDCVSRVTSECSCGLMGPWEIFPLRIQAAPNILMTFWYGKTAIFDLRCAPKQRFQRWALGLGAWKIPPRVGIWAYGQTRPAMQDLGGATERACLEACSG